MKKTGWARARDLFRSVGGRGACVPVAALCAAATVLLHASTARAEGSTGGNAVAVTSTEAAVSEGRAPNRLVPYAGPPDPGLVVPKAEPTEPPPPENRLLFRNTSLIRLNPVGLFDEASLVFRHRLYASRSKALRENFVGLGAVGSVTPAFGRGGPSVTLQPATVLSLTASYEWIRYFGTFNIVQSFPSPRAEYGDSLLKAQGDAGQNYAASARELTLQALVQAKVGPIAVRDTVKLIHSDTDTREGGRVFYHTIHDILVPSKGWLWTNDADLLYVGVKGLSTGVRHSMAKAMFSASDYAPGEPTSAPGQPVHRVGPLAAYTLYDDPKAKLNTPTFILLTQWWVSHRYRTGAEVSQAMPYVIMAFSATSDLL